jgi:hypothetical protein
MSKHHWEIAAWAAVVMVWGILPVVALALGLPLEEAAAFSDLRP